MDNSALLQDLKLIRSALVDVVGSDTLEELHNMAAYLKTAPAPEADKATTLRAIQILIDTQHYN